MVFRSDDFAVKTFRGTVSVWEVLKTIKKIDKPFRNKVLIELPSIDFMNFVWGRIPLSVSYIESKTIVICLTCCPDYHNSLPQMEAD